MYILSPVAYPMAYLLDWALGEDDGVVFGKTRLKTSISLQKNLDVKEVTIISSTLDLKERRVVSIMALYEMLRHRI